MNSAIDDLTFSAILTAVLLVMGAGLTFLGTIGLLRLQSFYERTHAPTLGTTLGAAFIAIASMIHFSVSGSHLVIHEALIIVFIITTTPVSLIVLVSAARLRDTFESRLMSDRNAPK